jgi:hypothetical protein
MRGVALGICPEATLVDITHDIAPQDIVGGAHELAAAVKYFPAGTVFLSVVDPGVGSTRRALAAEAGPYMFVAPDNGLLTMVFRQFAPSRIVELTEPAYALPLVSRTFEGRDRFAPAAAWLAKGTPLTSLGQTLTDWQKIDVPAPRLEGVQLAGVIVRIDRFGNLVTNIDRQTFERVPAPRHVARIAVADRHLTTVVSTYAEVAPGSLCALFGSTDHLEVAIAGGSAAERLGLTRGAPVVVRFDASA